jgi:hypothetical protein
VSYVRVRLWLVAVDAWVAVRFDVSVTVEVVAIRAADETDSRVRVSTAVVTVYRAAHDSSVAVAQADQPLGSSVTTATRAGFETAQSLQNRT